MYYDTATHAYDIPATYMVITTYSWGWNMNVKYYNPADGQYDLTSITPATTPWRGTSTPGHYLHNFAHKQLLGDVRGPGPYHQ